MHAGVKSSGGSCRPGDQGRGKGNLFLKGEVGERLGQKNW